MHRLRVSVTRRFANVDASVINSKVDRRLSNYFTSSYHREHGNGTRDGLPRMLWYMLPILASISQASAEEQNCNNLPVVTRAEVEGHKTKDTGVWVIYKDGVYDITKFIANHPGGRDKIALAAGGDIEPYWNVYRQHLNSPLAEELLKSMKIAKLHPNDIAAMQAEKSSSKNADNNPYRNDPVLSPIVQFYQRQPINAEPPGNLLGNSWITPTDMWFVRNHHPVPTIDPSKFQLDLVVASDLMGKKRTPGSATDEFESSAVLSLKLDDLIERFPSHTVVSSVQCGGNRRAELTKLEKTNGSSWTVSAFSTAKWKGVKLRDVLASAGITEDTVFSGANQNIKHVHFVSADGMEASIPIRKALDRFGDVLLAYEMNDEPLPTKHGYPLRAIVPGHVGVRNVKWVAKIRLSGEEAHGTWQRGMAYKGFGPSVKSLEGIDVEAIPSLQEQPVQSALTISPNSQVVAGDVFTAKGYAYSGGGRGIIRVDVSIDGGKTWKDATLLDGSQQPLDRAWAWTLWECNFTLPENSAGQKLEVICKATDASYNVQPDGLEGIWNLRGINNNAWHRLFVDVVAAEDDEDDDDDDRDVW